MGLGAFVFFLRKKAVLRTIFPWLDSLLKGTLSVRLFIYINVYSWNFQPDLGI